ncbi:MAG: 50S ribosomal protein L34e [Candidatus Micrarchaeia archaeon]
MPLPKNRSNSVRTIKYKTPSGENRIRYKRRVKGNKHVCAVSGQLLTGVNSFSTIAKSKRKPSRPFGGRLSPSVSRKVIKLRARLADKQITLDDVPIELLPYMKSGKQ